MVKTIAEVQLLGGYSQKWSNVWKDSAPQQLTFRWQTEYESVGSAEWQVTTDPVKGNVIASGNAGRPPDKGKVSVFKIDFADKKIAGNVKQRPMTYYVRVVTYKAVASRRELKKELGIPSPPVRVTLIRGESTQFTEWSTHADGYGEGFIENKHLVYYYDKNFDYQQEKFNELYGKKYKMISKCVSGDFGNARFSAVWVKTTGPGFHSFTVTGANQYQQKFNEWVGKGYHPAILSVSGSTPNSAVFTGTFVKASPGDAVPLTRSTLTNGSKDSPGTIQAIMKKAREDNLIPIWISQYGTAANPRYAGIWVFNAKKVMWDFGLNEPPSTLQERYEAHKSHRARPALVTPGPGSRYSSIFTNDEIGTSLAWSSLTKNALVEKINNGISLGYQPIRIEAYKTGAVTYYAVLLAKRLTPLAPQFQTTGEYHASLNDWDIAARNTMQQYNIQAGALAVVYKGKLVHARGYTYAPAGYPATQPTSMFRVASVSKVITAIAIHRLVQDGKLSVNSFFKEDIPIQNNGNVDKGYNQIRIKHVLSHSAGFKSKAGRSRQIADDLQVGLPVTLAQKRLWCSRQPLKDNFTVGSDYSYSNIGYTLLGQLIQKVSGQFYVHYVNAVVLSPLGLSRPRIGTTYGDTPREVRYQPKNLALVKSAFDKNKNLDSKAYEGRNFSLNLSSGGWIFSAPDLAKVLAAFHSNVNNPVLNAASEQAMLTESVSRGGGFKETYGWPTKMRNKSGGGTVRIYSKGGLVSTASASIQHRADDISFVLLFNKASNGNQKYMGPLKATLHKMADLMKASDWPVQDLFPQFNIPSF